MVATGGVNGVTRGLDLLLCDLLGAALDPRRLRESLSDGEIDASVGSSSSTAVLPLCKELKSTQT
jgi:hypothetical protein